MIWKYYRENGRHDLPWRKTTDPYKILVSEMMLQQTQVDRVIPKYKAFLKEFPSARALARAPLSDVLSAWSGLGYNRRALYLQRAAQALIRDHGGRFPQDAETLERLPGIGPYTARAIVTFAYNGQCVFIETNIRRVFIHAFFPDADKVSDDKLFPLIESSLPKNTKYREWYWALMDYGSHIKSVVKNPNRRSAHYSKQSKFEGSVRQLRGEFIRQCGKGKITKIALLAPYKKSDKERAEKALASLIKDGILVIDKKLYVTIRK